MAAHSLERVGCGRRRALGRLGLTLAWLGAAIAHSLPAASTGATPDERALWEAVLRLEFRPVYRAFGEARAAAAPAAVDEWDFGRALTALSVQPRTRARVDEAAALLEAVVARESPLTPLAHYFLGRIAQIHRDPADLPTARRHFETLLTHHAGSLAADWAAPKLALLRLIQQPADHAERIAAVPEMEALLERVARPELRFSLHLVIADACQYYGLGEPTALRHMIAALELDTPAILLRRRLLARTATAAARQGDSDLLDRLATRYLEEFPRGPEAGYVAHLRDASSDETRTMVAGR
jgi:hypothetical protein